MLNLVHQTTDQLLARLRERYRNSSNEETAKISKFIVDRIALGDFTDAQVRDSFGLLPSQWAVLKTKMGVLAAKYVDLRSAGGE